MDEPVLEITDKDEFLKVLDTHERVVVDFTAPSWCVPVPRHHLRTPRLILPVYPPDFFS